MPYAVAWLPAADYETSKPWLDQVVKISPSAQDPPVAMPERR